ncbi:MAG: hypothetical protein WD425_17330 [Nitrospirales bacterium]
MLQPYSEWHDAYVNFMKTVFLELRDHEPDARLVDEAVDTHHIFPGLDMHYFRTLSSPGIPGHL